MLGKIALAASPLLIFAGLWFGDPRMLALVLLAILVMRNATAVRRFAAGLPASDRWIYLLPILLTLGVALTNSEPLLRLYPAAVSLGMLALFGRSLVHPPTVVERIARLSEPDLAQAGVRYTRRITLVWCCFFVLNGAAATYTALYTSRETWVLYNGLVSYLLMGTLFLGERLIRPLLLARS